MRNLQKILALVLALVMSLSLMATAGAREFTDGDQIDETFAESVDVLTGLEVFQGYPSGDFQPKGDITRAEVAAIIYRIATGDVTDSQVGIYADYNKFSDVPSDNWAAGYINYCANAEYIKGRGDGKFYPQDKVTGYEALAMILRVVGYDKNGEFTGADWQVQTAATANQRKVTKNVNAGTLGNPASRETVAELLCQAILIEKVNYTLAFGYQISTNPEDTIAYETFKMEKLEGVVTGNEIADLKENSPLSAGQTRLVIDGREEIMDIPTGLESIGKSVRAYIRPQGGTTRKQLVTADVYDTELNHVYDSFAPVSTVGNSTGSEQGINSIVGAEHFVNYDFVNRWTAAIRITYVMDMKWTEYEAKTMRLENGGRLFDYDATRKKVSDLNNAGDYTNLKASDAKNWATQLTTNADYTYTYTKTIALDEMLTNQDYSNLLSIFTNADKTGSPGTWITGEVYVGTASFDIQKDISDDIRWTDFVNTYLVNEDNRAQVESNGRGNRLIIIDNDDDGIAEYVLQTIYTIAKISSDVKNVDVINQKLYDNSYSDAVNSTTPSNTLVSVSGKELAKSEDTLAAGDVVIYALIDGNIRAQKAETKTEKVNTVNRAGKTITVVGEDAATYNESAVHTHSSGLTSGVNGMAGNTNYTMYFDLDGNMAAYTEGANGGLVLITNGWHRSAIGGSEYAVQAYLDGSLQTVEVGASGAQFIRRDGGSNNQWGNLRDDFGTTGGVTGSINGNPTGTNTVRTIIANLDGNTLTPVDQAYFYSQNLRMLDMVGDEVPGMNNVQASRGIPYETRGGYNSNNANSYPAYNLADNQFGKYFSDPTKADPGYGDDGSYEVRGLSNTVYYVVYRGIGTDTMTNGQNVVVRQYTGSAPSIPETQVEDVYAVGAKATTATGRTYYTAQMVVIEVNAEYNKLSEQVFIPDFTQVSGNVGIEDVTMIRGNGEKVTVKVDMYNSYTYDWYNTAGDTTGGHRGERLPGLYFMDPSDTDPSVYVVKKMSPDEIRDNNYLVGYVEESISGTNGTLISRYPQIELKIRPNSGVNEVYGPDGQGRYQWIKTFGTDYDTALATRPLNGDGGKALEPAKNNLNYQGKNLTDDSVLYTYGGTTATLEVSSAYNVFAQNRRDDAGTTLSGLNERWNGDVADANGNYIFNQPNRNEVLVRYNGSGNIVWAVSFNENTTAQRVWWNCLPTAAKPADGIDGVPTLSGEGNTLTTTGTNPYSVEVPYSVWSAQPSARMAADGSFTIYFKAPGTSTIALNETSNFLKEVPRTFANVAQLAEDKEPTSVTVIVKGANGVQQSFTYVVTFAEAKTSSAIDSVSGGDAVAKVENQVITLGNDGKAMNIDRFKESFTFAVGATPAWRFVDGGGDVERDAYDKTTMLQVKYFEVVVTAEDGTTTATYSGVGGLDGDALDAAIGNAVQMKADVSRYLDQCGNLQKDTVNVVSEKVEAAFDSYIVALKSGNSTEITKAETAINNLSALVRTAANLFEKDNLTKSWGSIDNVTDDAVSAVQTAIADSNRHEGYTGDGAVSLTALAIKANSTATLGKNTAPSDSDVTDPTKWQIVATVYTATLKCGTDTIDVTWEWSSGENTYATWFEYFNPVNGKYIAGAEKLDNFYVGNIYADGHTFTVSE